MFKKNSIALLTVVFFSGATSYANLVSPETATQQSINEKRPIELQEEVNKNGIGIELLGKGGIWSLQYDHRIADQVGLGIGFSTLSGLTARGLVNLTAIPIFGNFYFAKGKSSMFGTLGVTPVSVSYTYLTYSSSFGSNTLYASGPLFNAGVGYEWRGGFLFRIALAPMFGAGGVIPWGGITLGATF